MTPKQRYLPLIRRALDPLLRAHGFTWKSKWYWRQVSDDLTLFIEPSIVRPIETGCLHVRWALCGYSKCFAKSIYNHDGEFDPCFWALDFEIKRFESPREDCLWILCDESQCNEMCSSVELLLAKYVFPLADQIGDDFGVIDLLEKYPSMSPAAPARAAEWLLKLKNGTDCP